MHEIQNIPVRGLTHRRVTTDELDADGNLVYEDPAGIGPSKRKDALASDIMKSLALNAPFTVQAPFDSLRRLQLFNVLEHDGMEQEGATIQLPDKLYTWLHALAKRLLYVDSTSTIVPKPDGDGKAASVEYATFLWGNEDAAIIHALKDAKDQAADLEDVGV